MSNLFPVKLFGLLNTLQQHQPWMCRQHPLAGMPEDNLMRIMLMSPGMHRAYTNKTVQPRFRLAFPKDGQFLDLCNNTYLEIYSADEILVEQLEVISMDQHLSVALEVELLTDILEMHDYHVTTL